MPNKISNMSGDSIPRQPNHPITIPRLFCLIEVLQNQKTDTPLFLLITNWILDSITALYVRAMSASGESIDTSWAY